PKLSVTTPGLPGEAAAGPLDSPRDGLPDTRQSQGPAWSGITEGIPMSDSRWNTTAPRGYAGQAAVVDAGLRAYMIRVYNYMAAAVALSGVTAWLTYQAAGGDAIRVVAGGISGLTPFGQTLFGPLMIVLALGTLGLVFFMSFRIHAMQASTAMVLFAV